MKINVKDILAEDIGYSRQFKIEGERPELKLVKLAGPITGEITVFRNETGVLVSGRLKADVELDCHRCLSAFTRHVSLSFSQTYGERPGDDDMPIENGEIDLATMIDQEIAVSLPMKLLCKAECEGISDTVI